MPKILTFLFAFCASISFAFATTPYDVVIDSDSKIQIDSQNPRVITGCWDSDENAVMFYRNTDRNIYASEICNEPDALHHGLGLTDKARALNYYDFLVKTEEEISQVKAPIVLGSLSGYNYAWLKEFLALDKACDKFDILAFHPYHLGVAPDEIDTSKDAYHTVEQWVNFYKAILKNAGCEKPIWVTEFGYTQSDYNAEKAVTAAQQSDFAQKQLVMLLANDVKRVSYFDKLTFTLSDAAAASYNSLVEKLVGAKFVSLALSGDNYCPKTSGCFYDASDYRQVTGKSVYGLPAEPTAMKRNRLYTFTKDNGAKIFVSWKTGETGITVVESYFSDVTSTTPYQAAITAIAREGIVNGYSDGTFRPTATINRAEFIKLLVNATDTPTADLTGSNCFSDVKSEWFAPYVCYAKTHGWVSGYADGKFLPGNPVNRAEALKMLANAFGYGISAATTSEAWYTPYVNIALNKGILLSSEALDYGNAQTRGFIAEMISRAMGL